MCPEDWEIYSPEAFDGTRDWPTKLVALGFILVLLGTLLALFL